MAKVLRHPLNRDRFALPFGLLASTSATTACNGPDGVPLLAIRAYPMPRVGWLISVSASVDVTAVGPGAMSVRVTSNGATIHSGPTFNTAATKQSGTSIVTPPVRIPAGNIIAVVATLDSGSATWDELIGWVEVELER